MKIAKKRLVSGVIAVILLSFCGCYQNTDISENSLVGETKLPESETVPHSEDENADLFALLEKEDFGGREFVIATTDEAFTDSESNSGIIGKALYRRNRAIEEKFNIKIKTVAVKDYLLQINLQSSSDPIYDLIYAPMDIIASCGATGLLMNIYSVPFFSFDEEYTQNELIESLSQNDTTYGVYGSAAFDDRNMWCVYYNCDILSSLGYDDPYSMVRDGSWTWDKFLEISNEAIKDLDGNGKMSKSKDRYGYSSTMNTSSFANAVFASFGKNYFSKDENGFFEMNFAETKDDRYMALLRRICRDDKSRFPENNPGIEAFNAFSEGRLAFFCEKLSYASSLAYIPENFGILPLPKKDSSQEKHYSLCDGTTTGYAVPQKISDSTLSGKVLDAIYLYDYCYGEKEDVVRTAYTFYYFRDNNSALAFSVMKKGIIYDAAFAFGAGMADFSMASYDILRSHLENKVDFLSLYTQNEKPFYNFVRQKFVH